MAANEEKRKLIEEAQRVLHTTMSPDASNGDLRRHIFALNVTIRALIDAKKQDDEEE